MVLSVGRIAATHLNRIYSGPPPGDVSVTGLINAAGEELCTAHPWEWLKGARATLDIAASATVATLPTDLRSIVAVTKADTLTGRAIRSTLTELTYLRENTVNVSSWDDLYWAVSQDRTTAGPPVRQLEIWPSQATARTAHLVVIYHAGWATVSDDDDLLTLPTWLEPLYLDFLKATALGWEEDLGADRTDRIDALTQSETFLRAVNRDADLDNAIGTMRNTSGTDNAIPWQHGYAYGNGGTIG